MVGETAHPQEETTPQAPEMTRLSDRTIVVVLEPLERTLEEYPLPRFIHISDGVLARISHIAKKPAEYIV